MSTSGRSFMMALYVCGFERYVHRALGSPLSPNGGYGRGFPMSTCTAAVYSRAGGEMVGKEMGWQC